jgi:hypothetical protein
MFGPINMFMKMHELFEAPISDINHIGDWDRNSSFRDQDRKLLTNPKAVSKIKSMWKYPEETMFNVLLVNHPDGNKWTEQGDVTEEWLAENMPRVYPQIKPLLKGDEVNIIFTNNKGSERVPMTGWIMAHRFGHALESSQARRRSAYYFGEAVQLFTEVVFDVVGHYGIRYSPTGWGFQSTNPIKNRFSMRETTALRGFFHAVATFRSAREGNIRDGNEVILELLAQYMTTGKIRFNDIPKSFKYGRNYYSFRGDQETYDQVNYQFTQELPMQLRDYLETAIHDTEGMIFVM